MINRAWTFSLLFALGCNRVASGFGDDAGDGDTDSTDDNEGDGIPGDVEGTAGDGDGDHDDDDDDDDDGGGFGNTICDFGGSGPSPGCHNGDNACTGIDLLFVIDNSATMSEVQLRLSASLPHLIEKLSYLTDVDGMPLNPDVNIMFTTTDIGHPECTPLQPEGYAPAQGAPQSLACTDRLNDFADSPELCTNGCPVPLVPIDLFIHYSGPMASTTNVPANDILGAMRCLAPQGVVGCGYEAPLEAMLQAISPNAMWNQGSKPFLREGGTLAIVLITDEEDCSVRSPEGYAYFTDPSQNTYWEVNPNTGTKTNPTSAVCWNSGVDCGAPDANGVYADCQTVDNGVLHPVDRYLGYLRDELIDVQHKKVVMLGLLGVPHVTQHHDQPPYQPIEGGVEALVYRQAQDPSSEFELGIGPGCASEDGSYQAVPPARLREVCEGLDETDAIRCCLESVCDDDFSEAMTCLTGMIQTVVTPIG